MLHQPTCPNGASLLTTLGSYLERGIGRSPRRPNPGGNNPLRTTFSEMAQLGGDDEEHGGHCEKCTGDDPSNSLESQGWDCRRNKPHSRNLKKQKPDFGEDHPGTRSASILE